MTPVQAALKLIETGMLEVRRDGTLWRLKRRKTDQRPMTKPHEVGMEYKGYRAYGFNYKGKWRFVRIHRLVYEYFNGPIPIGKEIHHRDNNKSNNNLSNLRALTHFENQTLAAQAGLYNKPVGERNPAATINEKMVEKICDCITRGMGAVPTARHLRISVHVVYHIIHGKTWTHLVCVQNLRWLKQGTGLSGRGWRKL